MAASSSNKRHLNITADTFVKIGGTSSQILMADGSTSTIGDLSDAGYVNVTGDTMTGLLDVQANVQSTQFILRAGDQSESRAFLYNGTTGEARLRLENGSNWGLIAKGEGNDPKIGTWNQGSLNIVGFADKQGDAVQTTLGSFDFATSIFTVNGQVLIEAPSGAGEDDLLVLRKAGGFGQTNISHYYGNNHFTNGKSLKFTLASNTVLELATSNTGSSSKAIFSGDIIVDSGTPNRTVKITDDGIYFSRTSDGGYTGKIHPTTTNSNHLDYHSRESHIFYTNGVKGADIHNGNITANSFIKDASSDSEILLGGGGTKAVSELSNIGGRNLITNTDIVTTTSSYAIRDYFFGNESLVAGEKVTVSIKGTLGADRDYFGLYNSGGMTSVVKVYPSDLDSDGVYRKTFNWAIGTDGNTFLRVYHMLASDVDTSTIEWIKLERGSSSSDWSYAPEELFIVNGSKPLSGDLDLANNVLKFTDNGATNIDHIWHDDTLNEYHFVSDSTRLATGNAGVVAGKFIKSGGTSSQFLKADGSVDSNTYLTAETDSQTLSWNGATGQISISNGNTIDIDGRYVDLTTNQTVGGNKTFSANVRLANNIDLIVGDGRSYLTGSGPNTELTSIGNIVIQADNDLASPTEFLDLRAGQNYLRVKGGTLRDDIEYNGNTVYHSGILTPDDYLKRDGSLPMTGGLTLANIGAALKFGDWHQEQSAGVFKIVQTGITERFRINVDGGAVFNQSVSSTGFLRTGSDNTDVLLGGGGAKAVSDFVDVASTQNITGVKTFTNGFVDSITNIGKTSTPYEILATGEWAAPIGSSRFLQSSSVGSPGYAGYWTVLGRRDTGGGYTGIYTPFGETYDNVHIGISQDTTDPVWLKLWTDANLTSLSQLTDDVVSGNYLPLSGGTMTGNINFSDTSEGITWNMNTDGAKILFHNTADSDTNSYLEFQTLDNGNEHFKWTHYSAGTTFDMMKLSDHDNPKLEVFGQLSADNFFASNPGATSWGTFGDTQVGHKTEIADGGSAYWLWSAATGSTFKAGFQTLGNGSTSRLYHNGYSSYITFSGSNITASKFITSGSSNQFVVLGDGTTKALAEFEMEGDFVDLTTNQTVGGTKTFTSDMAISGNLYLNGGQSADDLRIGIRASDNSNRFRVYTDLDNLTNNDKLYFTGNNTAPILGLTGDGKVGIGTTTPSETLEVNGNIFANSGSVTANKFTHNGDLVTLPNINQSIEVVDINSKVILRYTENTWDGTEWSTDSNSIGVGRHAMTENMGQWSVGVGDWAMHQNTGDSATGLGDSSMFANTGNQAIGIGPYAGGENTGDTTVMIGKNAGSYNKGDFTNVIGSSAGEYNEANHAVAIGSMAGYYNSGDYSIGVGAEAAFINKGSDSYFFGTSAGSLNVGNNNVGIGYKALYNNTGTENIILGNNSYVNDTKDYSRKITVTQANVSGNSSVRNYTYTNHGFTPVGGYILAHMEGGYTTNFNPELFFIQDANTLVTDSSKGSGGMFSAPSGNVDIIPIYNYDNVNILGSNLEPTRSNQTILGGLSVEAPNATIAEIDSVGNKALITKEWYDNQYSQYNGDFVDLTSSQTITGAKTFTHNIHLTHATDYRYYKLTRGAIEASWANSGDKTIFGTTSNHNVDFITNNVTRARIDNTGNFGIGTTAPNSKLDVVGDVTITKTDTPGDVVFDIQGSAGQLFSVTDSLEGDLFSVNDISGLPILNVNSEDTVEVFGHVNVQTGEGTGLTADATIALIDSTKYDAAHFDYTVKREDVVGLRTGTVMAIHDGTNVSYTDTSTDDLGGSTAGISMTVDLVGGELRLRAIITAGTWTVKAGTRTL